MKRILAAIAFAFVLVPLCGSAQTKIIEEPRKSDFDKTKPFMHAKLVNSQNVLEGVVTEDFERIFRSAENMKKMSLALQWPRADDEVYNHYGEQFRQICDKLMSTSKDENLEGVHFTYLSLTTSCVNCHNHVRKSLRVVRDKSNPKGPVRLIPTEWEGNTFRKHRSTNSKPLEN